MLVLLFNRPCVSKSVPNNSSEIYFDSLVKSVMKAKQFQQLRFPCRIFLGNRMISSQSENPY